MTIHKGIASRVHHSAAYAAGETLYPGRGVILASDPMDPRKRILKTDNPSGPIEGIVHELSMASELYDLSHADEVMAEPGQAATVVEAGDVPVLLTSLGAQTELYIRDKLAVNNDGTFRFLADRDGGSVVGGGYLAASTLQHVTAAQLAAAGGRLWIMATIHRLSSEWYNGAG